MLNTIKYVVWSIWKIFNYSILILIAFFNKKFKKKKIDNKNKKIMVLVDKICKGGAERMAVNVAEVLSKKYDVVIAMPKIKDEFKKIEQYHCTVNCVEINGDNEVKIVKNIKKYKKQNGITHCISFGTKVNFFNGITSVNDKAIISVRNFLSYSEQSKKNKLRHKIASKLCDYIVAVSKAVEYDQIKNYSINTNNICTIPNYCNKEYIEKCIKDYDIDDNDKHLFKSGKVVINVGKLKFQKGQWHLIRAFKEVVKKHKDAKLIIIGMGELEEYLKKLIMDMHLENNVFLLGHKNKNIYTYMAKSDIFAFSSLYEGMPNVILEAMACNLPIIAADCYGGNKEIIAPNLDIDKNINKLEKCEFGILLPKLDMKMYNYDDDLTNEEKILADAIGQMLDNGKLLYSYKEKSAKRIIDYSQTSYDKMWEDMLDKV